MCGTVVWGSLRILPQGFNPEPRLLRARLQKRPVREVLSKGPRSEEDLLKEQEEFFSHRTAGEIAPAAALAPRKLSTPNEPIAATSAQAAKPMSKFALERQRKREASAAAALPGASASAAMQSQNGSVGKIDIGARAHDSDGQGAERSGVHGVVGEGKRRFGVGIRGPNGRKAPAKPEGEPMSVVDMKIVERSLPDARPLAPTQRSTPAPVAAHRMHKAAAVQGGAGGRWQGRAGCRRRGEEEEEEEEARFLSMMLSGRQTVRRTGYA